jgi:hypothetical protein
MDTIKPIMTPKPLVLLAFAVLGIVLPIETSIIVEHADSTHDIVRGGFGESTLSVGS